MAKGGKGGSKRQRLEFSQKLVLNQWLISLFGVDPLADGYKRGEKSFHKLAEHLRVTREDIQALRAELAKKANAGKVIRFGDEDNHVLFLDETGPVYLPKLFSAITAYFLGWDCRLLRMGDSIETFNCLVWLRVKHTAATVGYYAEFERQLIPRCRRMQRLCEHD